MMNKLSLELRLFFITFILSLVVSTASIWVSHYYISLQTNTDFELKYKTLSSVLGNTLFQLESNTDLLMQNAAKVIKSEDAKYGILSTEKLKYLASSLNLTHIFVTDNEGNFIRSTNEDPKLIPNLFSFCDKYRQLITGDSSFFKTPIIPPHPEPNPYKFFMVPTEDKKRIIEVGIKAEFISNTLAQALKEDENIKELHLYAPDGTSLGSISRSNSNYEKTKVDLSEIMIGKPTYKNGEIIYYSKIPSSQPICCQCDNANLSRSGEYFYVLKSQISTNALISQLASNKKFFWVFQFIMLLICVLVTRKLSVHLVKSLISLTTQVENVRKTNDINKRINIQNGSKEIINLTKSFNELLDTLQNYQIRLLENEKDKAAYEIAKQVAHDIMSPLSAMDIALKGLKDLPESNRNLLKNASLRIRQIADELLKRHKVNYNQNLSSIEDIKNELQNIVNEKSIVYPKIKFEYKNKIVNSKLKCFAEKNKLKRIISNLINNSVESCYLNDNCNVEVEVLEANSEVEIVIRDNGPGIPNNLIDKIGKLPLTTKDDGNGIAIYSASELLKTWKGSLTFNNLEPQGCEAVIRLNALQVDLYKNSLEEHK